MGNYVRVGSAFWMWTMLAVLILHAVPVGCVLSIDLKGDGDYACCSSSCTL